MSVQNPKSTLVTNYIAIPIVSTPSTLSDGVERVAGPAVVESTAATALDSTSKCRFFRLPIDAVLLSLMWGFDDFGNAGASDLGLYSLDSEGSITVVDADEFATAIDINAAAVAPTERRWTNKGIETGEQKLWELAGASTRPTTFTHYEVVATISTTTQSAGTMYCYARYKV